MLEKVETFTYADVKAEIRYIKACFEIEMDKNNMRKRPLTNEHKKKLADGRKRYLMLKEEMKNNGS